MPHFEVIVDSDIFLRKTVIRISDVLVVYFGKVILVECKLSIEVSFALENIFLSFSDEVIEFFHFLQNNRLSSQFGN